MSWDPEAGTSLDDGLGLGSGLSSGIGNGISDSLAGGGAAPEIPLQYRQLWAQARPTDGRIDPEALAALLARARVDGAAAVTILEDAGVRGGAVDEPAFYRAAAAAAQAQRTAAARGAAKGATDVDADAAAEPGQRPESATPRDLDLLPDVPPGTGIERAPATHAYAPFAPDAVRVALREELEGSFLFRHALYSVETSFADTAVGPGPGLGPDGGAAAANSGAPARVLRRYSDFAWLLERLAERYPFRVLASLPPKHLTVNGRFVGGDGTEFAERRRRGLARFANLLVQHPVVARDELVRAFFSLQASGDTLRARYKAAPSGPELAGRALSPLFVARFDAGEYAERLSLARHGTEAALAGVAAVGALLERAARRRDTAATDAVSLTAACSGLSGALPRAYHDAQDDLPALSAGLAAVGRYANSRTEHIAGSAAVQWEDVAEQFKKYRGMLVAVQQLLSRHSLLGGNEIPRLERKLAALRTRIATAATKPDTSDATMHKLHNEVHRTRAAIRDQTTRDWLVKEAMTAELAMVQTTQYQLGIALRALGAQVRLSSDAAAEAALKLNDALETLPTKPT